MLLRRGDRPEIVSKIFRHRQQKATAETPDLLIRRYAEVMAQLYPEFCDFVFFANLAIADQKKAPEGAFYYIRAKFTAVPSSVETARP